MTHMQNVPESWELFDVGDKKVKSIRETKIPNAYTYVVDKEDHTLGNLIQCQLLKDNQVIFAGYRMPHPLEHKFELKIQTDNPSYPARAALDKAITELEQMLEDLGKKFDELALDQDRAGLGMDQDYYAEDDDDSGRMWERDYE